MLDFAPQVCPKWQPFSKAYHFIHTEIFFYHKLIFQNKNLLSLIISIILIWRHSFASARGKITVIRQPMLKLKTHSGFHELFLKFTIYTYLKYWNIKLYLLFVFFLAKEQNYNLTSTSGDDVVKSLSSTHT